MYSILRFFKEFNCFSSNSGLPVALLGLPKLPWPKSCRIHPRRMSSLIFGFFRGVEKLDWVDIDCEEDRLELAEYESLSRIFGFVDGWVGKFGRRGLGVRFLE